MTHLTNDFTTDDGLPTEDEIRRYEDLGFHIAPPVIPHELLDAVRDRVEPIQSGERDRTLDADARFSDWRPGDADVVRNNEFCSLQNDVVRDLVRLPIIGAIAARLARTAAVRLFDDQLIVKPAMTDGADAQATAVGWHTDGSYWSTCTSDQMLTAWIPLHDTSSEGGTLCVIAGSHLWPESEHLRGFKSTDMSGIGATVHRDVAEIDLCDMVLKKGQFSLHHMRAIHGSMPNRASTPRCAVAVHMQDDGNAHQTYRTPDGTEVVLPHDRLCRAGAEGAPDYRDPAIFPQLWPAG